MTKYYVLNGKEIKPVADLEEWAKCFELTDRHVAHETIGAVSISTVFLGIDHNFFSEGRPLLFESMVFGGKLDQEQRRYSTWDEAEAGHKELVDAVRKSVLN